MEKIKNNWLQFFKKRILLTVGVCLLFTVSASSQTSDFAVPLLDEMREVRASFFQPEEIIYLKITQVSKAGLLQNYDIQIAQTDWKRAKLDELKQKGRYDFKLDAAYQMLNDKAEQPSIVFGAHQERGFNASVSKLLPTGTTLGMDYEMMWSQDDTPFAAINPNYDGKTTFTLTQALLQNFFGVLDRTAVDIARLKGKIQGADTMERIESEILAIRTAYWDLALAMENYDTGKQFLETSEKLLKIGERKFRMGTMEKADLLNLMSQTRVRAEQWIMAENDVRLASNHLAFLLGINLEVVYLSEDPLTPSIEKVSIEDQLDTAFKQRDAYKRAELNAKRYGLEVKSAGYRGLPKAEVVASYGMNGLDTKLKKSIYRSFKKDHPTYYVGVQVSMPLENRQARAEYGQAKSDRERAEIELKKTAAQINREVWDAYLNLLTLQKQLRQTGETLKLEEEKYNAELAQFRIARSNTERLTQFQNDWISAKVIHARNRRGVLVAQDNLSRVRGTLLKDSGLTQEGKDDA